MHEEKLTKSAENPNDKRTKATKFLYLINDFILFGIFFAVKICYSKTFIIFFEYKLLYILQN